ncbi:hypothetical protein M9Y10_045176 [Tritrichomonas musculus]|uniref:DUF4833 domain-containing protein n=1 Tax=Tritrichomonas musculus TaxID=1915356 RepID=A0ABR2JUW2_9EUKA
MSLEEHQHLFDIANTVCSRHVEYRAIENGDTFSINVGWYTRDGERARDLNWLETTFAYGSKVSYDKKTKKTNMTVSALKSRNIEISKNEKGEIQPIAIINGKKSILKRIWVEVSDGHLKIPKVHYVDAFGVDIETGEEVTERVH